MAGRRAPLLWGGCFLLLVLLTYFVLGGYYLPNPLGVKILQALGVFGLQSPQLVWEYAPRRGDVVLPHWGEGGFALLDEGDAAGKAIALDGDGRELWQRELGGEVRIQALKSSWLTTTYDQGEVCFYQDDGRLAWRQCWTWPLQDIFLSPRGELAVFLGPLWEEGINHIEKLVLVNKEGQTVWEHPLRNGTILGGAFDRRGEYFALIGLNFCGDDMKNRALLFNRRGEICGEFSTPREDYFLATSLGEGAWYVAGHRALYCLDYAGAMVWQYIFGRTLQSLQADPARGGLVAVTLVEGDLDTGSILSYLDREGELAWEHSFCTPAEELKITTSQRGIIVADNGGIYGLTPGGDIRWYYSLPQPRALFAHPQGKKLLVAGADGVVTLFALPE